MKHVRQQTRARTSSFWKQNGSQNRPRRHLFGVRRRLGQARAGRRAKRQEKRGQEQLKTGPRTAQERQEAILVSKRRFSTPVPAECAARKSLSWRKPFQARSSPQAVVGGFNRFAHSAGPGIEGSCLFASIYGGAFCRLLPCRRRRVP